MRFPALSEEVVARPIDGLIVAFITVPLVVEGLRRTVGMALTIVVLVFLGYALVGHLVPGALAGRPVKLTQLAFYLVWDSGSMLGLPLMVATTIVIAFVFFGNLLFASGGSAFFTDIALTLMGRYRGGSAKIAVTASCLFGMISGSAVSNVASVGVIDHSADAARRLSRPCRRCDRGGGLDRRPIDAAGDGRRRIPDGRVPAGALQGRRVAAALPALLYYYALFIQADLLAARSGLSSIDGSEMPPLRQVLAQGWHFLLPFGGADLRAVLAQLVAGKVGARRLRGADGDRLHARLRRHASSNSAMSSTRCPAPAWPRSISS